MQVNNCVLYKLHLSGRVSYIFQDQGYSCMQFICAQYLYLRCDGVNIEIFHQLDMN